MEEVSNEHCTVSIKEEMIQDKPMIARDAKVKLHTMMRCGCAATHHTQKHDSGEYGHSLT